MSDTIIGTTTLCHNCGLEIVYVRPETNSSSAQVCLGYNLCQCNSSDKIIKDLEKSLEIANAHIKVLEGVIAERDVIIQLGIDAIGRMQKELNLKLDNDIHEKI